MTKNWLKKAELYKQFSKEKRIRWLKDNSCETYIYTPPYDFSEKAAKEMFDYESRGIGNLENSLFNNNLNGYFYGKRVLDITVSMWREDLPKGLIFKEELYKDYPKEFIDGVLS